MKFRNLLPVVFFLSFLVTSAQKKGGNAFAIVSSEPGKMEWMTIREIDLSTGQVVRTIFDKTQTRYSLINARSNEPVPASEIMHNGRKSVSHMYPTATMVAAAAFDKRHNKLFFSPMQIGDLRWIDLYQKEGVLKVYCLSDQIFSPGELKNESNHLTRMVIASDGNGYALSNDANHFIRFTTGKKTVVTKLGKIQDHPGNKDFSIHSRNIWGGDMIADAYGNLYVISANQHVFKINIKKQVATHLGTIEGIPASFTTNGAAVDDNGNLVVSSAVINGGYYKVDLLTLKAEKEDIKTQVSSCSDLATGNLAFDKSTENSRAMERRIDWVFKQISVYPNPVQQGIFKVTFDDYQFGKYDIQLADLSGRIISVKSVSVGMKGQTEDVLMDSRLTRGAYIVNIVNKSKKVVSSGKIIYQ